MQSASNFCSRMLLYLWKSLADISQEPHGTKREVHVKARGQTLEIPQIPWTMVSPVGVQPVRELESC